jgi:hypothetical protein
LTLDIFRSVRFAHKHMIAKLSDTSLNAFYYTRKTEAYDHSAWNGVTVSKAVRAVPAPLEEQPLFLSIDDTMIEKSGKHFELCSKLYDHAAHNGSNYLNGHCMVSLLLSFPVSLPLRPEKRAVPDRRRGDRISPDDIILNKPENGDWLIGMVPVITNLCKDKVAYALVTAPKTGKGAAVCFYARLIQEAFPLTGRTAQ